MGDLSVYEHFPVFDDDGIIHGSCFCFGESLDRHIGAFPFDEDPSVCGCGQCAFHAFETEAFAFIELIQSFIIGFIDIHPCQFHGAGLCVKKDAVIHERVHGFKIFFLICEHHFHGIDLFPDHKIPFIERFKDLQCVQHPVDPGSLFFFQFCDHLFLAQRTAHELLLFHLDPFLSFLHDPLKDHIVFHGDLPQDQHGNDLTGKDDGGGDHDGPDIMFCGESGVPECAVNGTCCENGTDQSKHNKNTLVLLLIYLCGLNIQRFFFFASRNIIDFYEYAIEKYAYAVYITYLIKQTQ